MEKWVGNPWVGLTVFVFGLFTMSQSFFIIQISKQETLWWLVINSINLTPWNLMISWGMLAVSLIMMPVGFILMITARPEGILPEKDYDKLAKRYFPKNNNYYLQSAWITFAIFSFVIFLYELQKQSIYYLGLNDDFLKGLDSVLIIATVIFFILGYMERKSSQKNHSSNI